MAFNITKYSMQQQQHIGGIPTNDMGTINETD